jgi:hypothetical protein
VAQQAFGGLRPSQPDLSTPSAGAIDPHDVIEDTPTAKDEIVARFGREVGEIVDGVSKLDKVQFKNKKEAQAESFSSPGVGRASSTASPVNTAPSNSDLLFDANCTDVALAHAESKATNPSAMVRVSMTPSVCSTCKCDGRPQARCEADRG